MGVSNMHHTQAQTQGQQFLPPLLPPNLQAHLDDPGFSALLEETRTILCSSDFSRVLEVCLDSATEILYTNNINNIGGTASSAVSPGIGGGVNGIRGAFHYAGLNDPLAPPVRLVLV